MDSSAVAVLRRSFLQATFAGAVGLAGATLAAAPSYGAADDTLAEDIGFIERLTGGIATESPKVHLDMPAVFGNGYSVPLSLSVDSPMTEADHVRLIRVIAPRNPIVMVANFQFDPQSGRAAIATRVRLAKPQNVIAVAEMSDGSLLMARTWVKVDTNGCA